MKSGLHEGEKRLRCSREKTSLIHVFNNNKSVFPHLRCNLWGGGLSLAVFLSVQRRFVLQLLAAGVPFPAACVPFSD